MDEGALKTPGRAIRGPSRTAQLIQELPMVFEQQYHTDIRDMFVREMPETAVQQMNAIMICRLIGEKGPEIQKVTLQLVKVMLKRKKRVSELPHG